jgi:hypothetical protein
MATKINFVGCMILVITFICAIINIDGYIIPSIYNKGGGNNYKRQSLKLRNSNNQFCNEKFIYMKYLVGIRNFKKLYRIIKDNSNIDIQNIINIINNINITQLANIADNNYNNSLFINNSMFINNTYCNNNNKTVKNLVLSNIYIDVSNIKYIQISTRNDTLIVELDKNNANIDAPTNNIMYDITKIETLVSSISLIMKVLNIN